MTSSSPASSFDTSRRSTSLTMSSSRRRFSSGRISPVKCGSSNPTTSIWTGPIWNSGASVIASSPPLVATSHALQELLLLHFELGVRQDALVVQLAELRELLDHVLGGLGGRCRCLLRRVWRLLPVGLLRLELLEAGLLLVLTVAAFLRLLPRVVRRAAHHRGPHERPPSSHEHVLPLPSR